MKCRDTLFERTPSGAITAWPPRQPVAPGHFSRRSAADLPTARPRLGDPPARRGPVAGAILRYRRWAGCQDPDYARTRVRLPACRAAPGQTVTSYARPHLEATVTGLDHLGDPALHDHGDGAVRIWPDGWNVCPDQYDPTWGVLVPIKTVEQADSSTPEQLASQGG
jgi:hypothetical protein